MHYYFRVLSEYGFKQVILRFKCVFIENETRHMILPTPVKISFQISPSAIVEAVHCETGQSAGLFPVYELPLVCDHF